MSNVDKVGIVIWMNMPSHHQDYFFNQLLSLGSDLIVCYYAFVDERRKMIGWESSKPLSKYEYYVDPSIKSVEGIAGWEKKIHVIPGYGNAFLRTLIRHLSKNQVKWIHWSEPSRSGIRWLASYPMKIWYAYMVNRFAIGALSIGILAEKDFKKWGISKAKVSMLPYSISNYRDCDVDKEIQHFKGKKDVFLFVGEICKRKGVDLLIKAFNLLVKNNKNYCLVLVGSGVQLEKYKRMVERYDIIDSVLFRGVVPATDILSVYKASDVFVLPSRFDGWGMVVNEASSMGMPLIVSEAVGSSWHMVENSVNGYRVKKNSIKSLFAAMSVYTKAASLIKSHGIASKRIFDLNSSSVMAKKFIQIVETYNVVEK